MSQIKALVNHTMQGAYPAWELRDIPGVMLYGSRVYATTSPGDAVQLDPSLKGEFPWIAKHYKRVGLNPSEEVIWDTSIDLVCKFPGCPWDVFVFSELHHTAQPNERRLRATLAMNDKNQFIQLCQQHGWLVPETKTFASKAEYLKHPPRIECPVYRKTAWSAAGMGVQLIGDPMSLYNDINGLPDDVPFQLQQPVQDAEAFLNMQYEVRPDGTLHAIGLTEQILDGVSHAGNNYPTRYSLSQLRALCDPVAHAIRDMGMLGVFAFDVAVDNKGRVKLVECNPRPNAVTYYYKVAMQLGVPHWMCNNLSVRACRLSDLDLEGLEFNPKTGEGVIIVGWGTILHGKAGTLFAARTPETKCRLFQEFIRRNK